MSKTISGINAKLLQKNFIDAPRAIEGTIKGTFTKTSKTVEANLPALLLAMSTAMGNPIKMFSNVTTAPKLYDKSKLCQ